MVLCPFCNSEFSLYLEYGCRCQPFIDHRNAGKALNEYEAMLDVKYPNWGGYYANIPADASARHAELWNAEKQTLAEAHKQATRIVAVLENI